MFNASAWFGTGSISGPSASHASVRETAVADNECDRLESPHGFSHRPIDTALTESADVDNAAEEINMGIEIASTEESDHVITGGLQKLGASTSLSSLSIRPLSAPRQKRSSSESDDVAHARRQVQALVKMDALQKARVIKGTNAVQRTASRFRNTRDYFEAVGRRPKSAPPKRFDLESIGESKYLVDRQNALISAIIWNGVDG